MREGVKDYFLVHTGDSSANGGGADTPSEVGASIGDTYCLVSKDSAACHHCCENSHWMTLNGGVT